MTVEFRKKIESIDPKLITIETIRTLQVNLGNMCNQKCEHCHVQAGPNGKKIMPKKVMNKIIDFLKKHKGTIVDITGGSPELNPDFKYFIKQAEKIAEKIMVRTNLTILLEPGMEWIPKWCAKHKITLIASLPCYTGENVDKQRGKGIFEKSIKSLKILNELGYGKKDGLQLNLVYNPGADFLPSPQQQLQNDYKKHLSEDYGVYFNNLFTITNAPIGRFKQYLKANGQLKQYQKLLIENFNPNTAKNIMCRNMVSVDYRGIIYNCDFNQALGLDIINKKGQNITIENANDILEENLEIITGDHCFCCTAGEGSSCTGSLVE